MRLDDLNAVDDAAAARELLRCCGSTRWAARMAAARPFHDPKALAELADRIWWDLDELDWREAFAAHPKIGGAATSAWSAREQSGIGGASLDVIGQLAAANRDYEARFGYIFIICATGKSAAEMLAALELRLGHAPDREL